MSALKDVAKNEADIIREGIGWVIIYKTGRSWHSSSIWLNPDNDNIESDDMEEVIEILKRDAGAVILNGYYCGHFGEEMTNDEIANGIRWHYENGHNLLADRLPQKAEPETTHPSISKEDMEKAAVAFDAVIKSVKEAIELIAPVIQDTLRRVCKAVSEFVKRVSKDFRAFYDELLRAAADNPKDWHYYKHAKKARVRKKYRHRLERSLFLKLEAGP